MRAKFSILVICFIIILGDIITPPHAISQTPQFRIPIVVVDSVFGSNRVTLKRVRRDTVQFGVHPSATFCFDNTELTGFQDHWFYALTGAIDSQKAREYSLPPWSPAFEARMFNARTTCPPGGISLGLGVKINIHQFTSPTQIDTFKITFQTDPSDSASKLSLEWPSVLSFYCDSLRLQSSTYGVNENMLTKSKWLVPDSIDLSVKISLNIIMKNPKTPIGPPAPVILVSPPYGDTGYTKNVTVQWNAVTDAFYYRLQFSTDSTFATRIYDDTLRTTSKQFSNLDQSTWYYWRVFVSNPYGVSFFQIPPYKFQTKSLGPPPPDRIYPLNSAIDVPITPTISWHAVPSGSPVTYRIQIASDTLFSIIIKDTSVSDTSVIINGLQHCASYYWRINATNADGIGIWSTSWLFKIVMTVPTIPTLVNPNDYSTDVILTPTLSWTSGDFCAENYRLIVSKDSNFTDFVFNIITNQISVALNTLEQLTDYFWRVKAINSIDSSQYTPFRRFKTLLLPPVAPQLVSPVNGGLMQNPVDTIRWNGTAFTSNYNLQISVDQNFSSLVLDDSLLTDTFHVTIPLTNCMSYYWRVRGQNVKGWGNWSQIWNFKIKPVVPLKPTLVTPAANEIGVATKPTFTWLANDICSYNFRLQVAMDSSFGSIVLDIYTNQISFQPLNPLDQDTIFYWRVKSLNPIDSSQFTTYRKFRTIVEPPAAPPQLLSPVNGFTKQDPSGMLIWSKTPLTNFYHLQIAIDQGFTSMVFSDSSLTDTFHVTSSLTPLITYYWHVRSINKSGASSFSQAWNFKIKFQHDTTRYRTFTYEQLRDCSQQKLLKAPTNKIPSTKKPWYAPTLTGNLINQILKDELGSFVVGQRNVLYPWGKLAPWLEPAKYTDVSKTLVLCSKTGMRVHSGPPQPFNQTYQGTTMSKRYKTIPPYRGKDDILIAELLTLQVNLEASKKGHTPMGFGAIFYSWPGPWGRYITIDSLVSYGNKIMTRWVLGMCDPPINIYDYDSLYNAVRRINLAFAGGLDDTTNDGGWRSPKFKYKGYHSQEEFKFLGQFVPAEITLEVTQDRNGDGIIDSADHLALPSGTKKIYFDVFKNGVKIAQDSMSDGVSVKVMYFSDMGTYGIKRVSAIPPGWIQTSPIDSFTIIVDQSRIVDTVNFLYFKLLTVSGKKFYDLNGNGILDPGERGLQNWTINLTGTGGGTTITDTNGYYMFNNVGAGDHIISEVQRNGWVQTFPSSNGGTYPFTAITASQGGDQSDKNFGNYNQTLHIHVNKLWNLVSLPLKVEDARKTTLFPTATSSAFAYHDNYIPRDTLKNGEGYWLKFDSAMVVTLVGMPISHDTNHVREGWNIIGSLFDPLPVSDITSDPPGIVTSNVIGYASSYVITDTLYPGAGYWVKVSQAGSLILSTKSAIVPSARIKIRPTSELPPSPPSDNSTVQELPRAYGLSQAYPSPFNPTTTIKYQLPVDSRVTLKVYNMLGQVVQILVDGVQQGGFKSVIWTASDVASGVYYYRLEAVSMVDPSKTFSQVKKMILMK